MGKTFRVWSPAGRGGITVIGIKDDAGRFAGDHFAARFQLDGKAVTDLRYGILNDEAGRAVDEVLLVGDSAGRPSELTCHGGTALHTAVAGLLARENYKSDPGLRFFTGDAWECAAMDALRNCVSPAGAAHFAAYLGGHLPRQLTAVAEALESGRPGAGADILRHLCDHWQVRSGLCRPPVICLVGFENAGKSTLFNAIVGFERVVVTDTPGTTTDHVDETVLVQDYPVTFVDTRGFTGETRSDHALAAALAGMADGFIQVEDASLDREGKVLDNCLPSDKLICRVRNKSDRIGAVPGPAGTIMISALIRTGIDVLMIAVFNKVAGIAVKELPPGFFNAEQVGTAAEILACIDEGAIAKAADRIREWVHDG